MSIYAPKLEIANAIRVRVPNVMAEMEPEDQLICSVSAKMRLRIGSFTISEKFTDFYYLPAPAPSMKSLLYSSPVRSTALRETDAMQQLTSVLTLTLSLVPISKLL